MRETLGCEQPTQVPATWLEAEEEFYNCPIRFIPTCCYEFIEKYNAYKNKMATPPDYEKQSARFNQAVKVFENYLNQFIEEKQGRK
jgi:hypothetical protein